MKVSRNQTLKVSKDQTFKVFKKPNLQGFQDQTFKVFKNQTLKVSRNQTFKVSKDQTLKVFKNKTLKVSRNQTLKVSRNQTFKVFKGFQNVFINDKMQKTKSILLPDRVYHVFNRANGNEHLFCNDENYRFFLRKHNHYIQPIANTLCYCLMPNHFHFLVRIRPEADLEFFFKEKINKKMAKATNPEGFQNLEGLIITLISKQFGNFFNAYAKAFNKQHNRIGNLFMHTYKRKQVNDEAYLRKLVHYIHYNPIEAGLTDQYDWKYSSYPAIISKQTTKIAREEVIGYFDDLENFKYCHKYPPKITGIE